MENKKKQIKIQIDEAIGQGEYANFAIVTHSAAEFIMDFVRILPGMQKSKVKSRVIISPIHTKTFLPKWAITGPGLLSSFCYWFSFHLAAALSSASLASTHSVFPPTSSSFQNGALVFSQSIRKVQAANAASR